MLVHNQLKWWDDEDSWPRKKRWVVYGIDSVDITMQIDPVPGGYDFYKKNLWGGHIKQYYMMWDGSVS